MLSVIFLSLELGVVSTRVEVEILVRFHIFWLTNPSFLDSISDFWFEYSKVVGEKEREDLIHSFSHTCLAGGARAESIAFAWIFGINITWSIHRKVSACTEKELVPVLTNAFTPKLLCTLDMTLNYLPSSIGNNTHINIITFSLDNC